MIIEVLFASTDLSLRSNCSCNTCFDCTLLDTIFELLSNEGPGVSESYDFMKSFALRNDFGAF